MNLAEKINKKSTQSELSIFNEDYGAKIEKEKELITKIIQDYASEGMFSCSIYIGDISYVIYQTIVKWLKKEGFKIEFVKPYESEELKDVITTIELDWSKPEKKKETKKEPYSGFCTNNTLQGITTDDCYGYGRILGCADAAFTTIDNYASTVDITAAAAVTSLADQLEGVASKVNDNTN